MFDWKDYSKLSEIWKSVAIQDPLHEAYYRSSISRSYYFVYNFVKKFALSNGYKLSDNFKGGRHAEMIWYLNNNNKNWSGGHLSKLRKNRNDSDYEEDKVVDQRLNNASLLIASYVINDLNSVYTP